MRGLGRVWAWRMVGAYLGWVAGVTGAAQTPTLPNSSTPPNIIFILADDLGIYDLACYGRADHHTPHLDRLASQGVRFSSAYCDLPLCSPTRAAILTGRSSARLHLTTFLPGRPDTPSQKLLQPKIVAQLPIEEKTLPEYLKEAGYTTACVGKWHLGGKGAGPADQGFDFVHPGKANTTPSETEGGKGEYDLTDAAEKFIEANRHRPFFLYLCHNSPHIPYTARQELIAKNAKALEPVYAAVIETLDDSVGRLLGTVDRLQLGEKTLVIFTSDNGGLHVPEGPHRIITHNGPYRAGKGFLYEGGLRVPLIVRWPGKVPAGKLIDCPIIHTDWVPTLLECAGLPVPKNLDGVSFGWLLGSDPTTGALHRTGSGAGPRRFFWHFPHYSNQGGRPSGAVREGPWKLIEDYETGEAQLYNLDQDISETQDLAAVHPDIVTRLRRALDEWRKAIGAQMNTPNPNFDPAQHRSLYLDIDPSRFHAQRATPAQIDQMQQWRAQMNAAVAHARKPKPKPPASTDQPVSPRQSKTGHEGKRPNIVIILADDMGYSDPGCYGGEIETPHLDRLARGGLRFTQCYNTARCWPSRAAIMTGYYAQQIRRDTVPGVRSGNQGVRPPWAPLISELLHQQGYRCYHSGKWHIDGSPLAAGFDHSYLLHDHNRFFTPNDHLEDDQPLDRPKPEENYYATTAIGQYAIKYLDEHARRFSDRPFFLYLCFTAPHFPLQAPQETVAQYLDRYRVGWNVIQEQRGRRLLEMGLVHNNPPPMEIGLGPPYHFPEALISLGPGEVNRPLPWNQLSAEQQAFQASKMAVHAAMVHLMDRAIGEVLAQLEKMEVWENTLILFASDNGASAEIMVRGDGHDRNAPAGSAKTFLCLGPGWSSASNTPFRRHKTWVHEGGISTPLIVHWPTGINSPGQLRHTPVHFVDVFPTVLDLLGLEPPERWNGKQRPPLPGKSILPLFAQDGTVSHDYFWFLHEGHRAIRVEDWKLVAARNDPWELYHLAKDRGETQNLVSQHPKKASQLEDLWNRLWQQFQQDAQRDLPADQIVPKPRPKSRPVEMKLP